MQIDKCEIDEEFFLRNEWKRYINQQHNKQMRQIELALNVQEMALNELKRDNVHFFLKAVQVNIKK